MNADELFGFSQTLYPILRSITGRGVRESLALIRDNIPITIHSVPTGTQVLDWAVPEEWSFDRATIRHASTGELLLDSADNHLSALNYTGPVKQRVTREELNQHLHTLPENPDAIPYRTSYYNRTWGFCARHSDTLTWGDGPFDVQIDAHHFDGELNYGELVIPGDNCAEIIISTHICHPALANDNVSGMVLTTALAQHIARSKPYYTWRFLFVPGTIGAITWLAQNRASLDNIIGGLVLTGLGDRSPFTYKKTPDGNQWIDFVMGDLLTGENANTSQSATDARLVDFDPYGYDERQYCSPGFRLPMGRFTRAVHGTLAQYHTSDDNLDFITPETLFESLEFLTAFAARTNSERFYCNQAPTGEPQLGKRGLYGHVGASPDPDGFRTALLWLLNACDGQQSLTQIQHRTASDPTLLTQALNALLHAGLLKER